MSYDDYNGEISDTLSKELEAKVLKEGDISPSIIDSLNNTSDHYIKGFDNSDEGLDSITELYKTITKLESVDNTINEKAGEGFETLLGGTILKQIVKYNTKENDSGYRKRIFIRWDMLCQIFNKLAIFEYKKNHPITEFTYLNSNRLTFAEGEDRKNAPDNTFYLNYSVPTPTNPIEGRITGFSYFGQSLDDNICIMPHQAIFDNLFERGFTRYDPVANDVSSKETWTGGIEVENNLTPDKRAEVDDVQGGIPNAMNFTSFNGVTADRNSIGLVYFNLDHVLEEYEDMRLESIDDGNGKFRTRLKEDFSLFDFVKKLWEDVNDACGGYYDFKLTTEHERPHVARIVDFTFSGKVEPNKPIYTFNPQGLNSVSRQFSFNSKISSDFASVISIAAQAPGSIHSLNAMSFKAFNKDIKSRFTTQEFEDDQANAEKDFLKQKLIDDNIELRRLRKSLQYYLNKLNKGNFEINSEDKSRPLINVNTAKVYQERIEELIRSISIRFPLKDLDKNDHPNAGEFRKGTTLDRNAIIPLTFNIQLDGIAGVIPLQLFKIQKDKLPLAYKRDDIAFIVKGETHQITSGQDWVVEINGQLTFLNTNENNDGFNPFFEQEEAFQNELDSIDDNPPLLNPTQEQNLQVEASSPWPRRNNGKDWHLGIDLAIPSGTPLVAVGDGIIERRVNKNSSGEEDDQKGYGYYVILTLDKEEPNSKAKKILYGHLSEFLLPSGPVKRGDVIGYSGGTSGEKGAGSSTGAHLHYEVGTRHAFTPAYFTRREGEEYDTDPKGGIRHQRIFYTGRIAKALDFQKASSDPYAGKNISVAEEINDDALVVNPLNILKYNGLGNYGEILYGPEYNDSDGAEDFEENAAPTGPQQAPVATDNL